MKKLLFTALTVIGTQAFAAKGLVYECDFNTVGNKTVINVTANTVTAELAYNNTTSDLNLVKTSLEKDSRRYVLFVLDSEKNQNAELVRMNFNLTYPSVILYTFDQNGTQTEVEKANCIKTFPKN